MHRITILLGKVFLIASIYNLQRKPTVPPNLVMLFSVWS